MSFYLQELSALRMMNHNKIDSICDFRQNLDHKTRNFGGSWHPICKKPITDKTINNLHIFLDWMLQYQSNDYFLKIHSDVGYWYTNSLEQIESLCDLDYIKLQDLKQIDLTMPRDSIRIKKSDYQYRTYFKNQTLSIDEKSKLHDMLANQQVRLGPSFAEWFNRYSMSRYVCDNFFVDHNSKDILLLINLSCPIKIRRTVNIISDK